MFQEKSRYEVNLYLDPKIREGSMAKNGKKKRKSTRTEEADDEPIGMNSSLRSKRRSESETVSSEEALPSLYKEDLGTVGIKKKKAFMDTSASSIGGDTFSLPLTAEEETRRMERQMRFSNDTSSQKMTLDAVNSALSASRTSPSDNETSKIKRMKSKKTHSVDGKNSGFIGTCQNIEKAYLRLTTFPKVEEVRPLSVLKQSLAHIKKRFIDTEDFDWANEQLKSVRQDLTVQGLKNEFVLEVYETHARIVLEYGALNEFNQCQTMIKSLTMGINGEAGGSDLGMDEIDSLTGSGGGLPTCGEKLLQQTEEAADEFGSYRLLYALVQKEWKDVTKELAYATTAMSRAEKPATEKSQQKHKLSSCEHSVLVTKAVIQNDYHAFFRLYESAMNLSAYLMDYLVQRVRAGAYDRIISAYRPTISVEFFREALRFSDLEETRQFLKQSGAVFVQENQSPPFWINCKASKTCASQD